MDLEVFNGIDFMTGDYLIPPVTTPELAEWALKARRDLKEERELRWSHERDFKNRGSDRRPAPDVDPLDLASSGWGVILPEGTPEAVLDKLRPLLAFRKEQASRKKKKYYRELDYLPGESKDGFFRRHEVEAGPAHPEQLPYYLLIVGSPKVVPYRFQYLLDMQYAVGRIYFDDPEDYRRYAESVVAAEGGQHHVQPEVCLFSVRTPKDRATKISDERLIRPLAESLETKAKNWQLRLVEGEQADKPTLRRLLGGGETPALLLTAAHGLGFPQDHDLQQQRQGAVICKEWPGRRRPVLEEHYFSAADVGDDARLHGLVAFLFGCYSAGTPDEDNFPPSGAWGQPCEPPPSEPFMSGLAHRLLTHPNGGALAVVGHVDRAWGCSFGSGRGKGILHIESFFQQLLQGFPIGLAMDWLNERFAEISTQLTEVLDRYKKDPLPAGRKSARDEMLLVNLWRSNNDARNFVVLGDPAVRLATGPKVAEQRAVLELRAQPGGLQAPVHSLWGRHVEDWLTKVGSRDTVDLGVDPAAAVRALRDREEGGE